MLSLKKIFQLFQGTNLQDAHELPVSEGESAGQTKKYNIGQIKAYIWAYVQTQIENISQGPQGPQGATGAQGVKGEKGDKGDRGDKGDAGLKGDAGPQGLQGIQGAKGDKGDTGAQGPQGIQGIQGAKGEKGDQGDAGLNGDDGADGISAYEVAVNNGFVGTEADWLESLKGEKGDQGDAGEQGPQGEQGENGADGAAGAPGVGVPTGGTTGQVLKKTNGTDYATEWGDAGVQVASDAETIAGTIDDKAVSPLKLKNWWTDVKTKIQTFAETITFTKAPKLNSLTANRILSLDASKNIEDILQKIVPVITSSTVTNLLNNDSNWRESDNVYIGTAISTQEQTQYWKNTDYWFFLYDSGTPVRIPIGGRIDHLRGRTSTPSISAGAAAGTTPSISISGTDLGFRITLTVGTSPTTGTLATVTFNRPYGSAPFVVTSPKNTNAAALSVRPYNTTTTTTLTLSVGTALTASTQYIWDFIIAQ